VNEFEEIVQRNAHSSELMAAFRASEQWFTRQQEGVNAYPVRDVVEHAWMKLTPHQQAHALDDLFEAWHRQVLAMREWIRLDGMAMTDATYLKHGDLDIIEDCLGLIPGGPQDALDETDICIPLGVAVRIVDELKLLRRREERKATEDDVKIILEPIDQSTIDSIAIIGNTPSRPNLHIELEEE
jgi:hypothetical protein